MKILPLSDLHLEFCQAPYSALFEDLPDADVLVLAGDITTAGKIQQQDTHLLDQIIDLAKIKSMEIIAICGNHEYYHLDQANALNTLHRYYTNKGVVFLHNSFHTINRVKFFGGPLGSNFNNRDLEAIQAAKAQINDYRCIHNWSPDDTIQQYQQFTTQLLTAQNIDVVISHFSPSKLSCHPKWAHDVLNNAYMHNNMEDIILEGQYKMWIHGHTHDRAVYKIGETQIVCNPKGYGNENQYYMPEVFTIDCG